LRGSCYAWTTHPSFELRPWELQHNHNLGHQAYAVNVGTWHHRHRRHREASRSTWHLGILLYLSTMKLLHKCVYLGTFTELLARSNFTTCTAKLQSTSICQRLQLSNRVGYSGGSSFCPPHFCLLIQIAPSMARCSSLRELHSIVRSRNYLCKLEHFQLAGRNFVKRSAMANSYFTCKTCI
jgi:hypothetical protein